jgi:hypothetical protein
MMPYSPDLAEQAYMQGIQLAMADDLAGSLRAFEQSAAYQPEDDSARVAGNLVRDAISGTIGREALRHFLSGAELAQRRSLRAITGRSGRPEWTA